MKTYLLGCDILGADVTIPKVDKTYTDTATVKTVQRGLMARGYALPKYGADGNYGEETAAAIRKFQKDMGVAVTGKIDYYVVAAFKSSGAGVSATAARAMADAAAAAAAQADQATTPVQVQQAAAQTVAASNVAEVPPEVKAQVAKAQQAAAAAVTPEQVQVAKVEVAAAAKAVEEVAKSGLPPWAIALIASGAAVAVVGAVWLAMRPRAVKVTP